MLALPNVYCPAWVVVNIRPVKLRRRRPDSRLPTTNAGLARSLSAAARIARRRPGRVDSRLRRRRAEARGSVGAGHGGGSRRRPPAEPEISWGPDRAVCLYSLELIEALRAEGHPITPGSIGENVVISGIDWRRMVPGVEVRLGEVEIELTSYALPCRNIRGSFRNGRIGRVSPETHPGWSRVYARVLREGQLASGDKVDTR